MKNGTNLTVPQLYEKVIEKVKSYHPNPNIEMINKAYNLALEAHTDQRRKSGEPYMIHPMSVALILAELELDSESIVAGILHDVVEDTDYTKEDLERLFSKEVADIVDGVTKLDKLQYTSKEELQADNYRKMFLAMAEDIRVILIKIADRLHNMRTLKYMPRHKQIEIAQETKDIYAPIAHKLGVSTIRYELEDLSFRYLEPDEYYRIADEINYKQAERKKYIDDIVAEIKEHLKKVNIEGEVVGRPKHFYSIYRKMQKQNKTLDQIHDLFAVRVLVETNAQCYAVLGVVNSVYYSVSGRFKDYISMPKDNMYQSLHNTLIGPLGEPFEIQIRTYDMHKVSEYGIAAHWKYKEGGNVKASKEDEKLAWLRQVLEWQRDIDNNGEFLGAIKGDFNLYDDRVYCFTPNGDLINLAKGANTIDFAYAIHSGVGNKMIGARVNGRIVPINHVLENTDRVEIITSKTSTGPSPDWAKIAFTPQARNKINQWFNQANKTENINKGRETIENEIKKRGYNYNEIFTEEMEKYVCERFKFKDFNSVCASIGLGGLKDGAVVNRIIEKHENMNRVEIMRKKNEEILKKVQNDNEKIIKTKSSGVKGVILNGMGFTTAKFSKCCSPLPGDDIVAFTTRGRGVTVHRKDCINITNLPENEKTRLLDAKWSDSDDVSYTTVLQIESDNVDGLFVKISNLFQSEKISIDDLNMRKQGDVVHITVEFSIKTKEELDKIKKKLSSIPEIRSVNRLVI